MNPIFFALLTAVSFGLWTMFHKLAAPYVDQVLGAILVSFTAAVVGAIILLFKTKNTQFFSDPKGFSYIILAGIAALRLLSPAVLF